MTRSFMICIAYKIFWSDQIKDNELGGACSTCGGEVRIHTGFWWGKLAGKRPLGKPRRGWESNINMNF